MTQEQKDKIDQLDLEELKLVGRDAQKLVDHYWDEPYPSLKWRRFYAQLTYIQNRKRQLMRIT